VPPRRAKSNSPIRHFWVWIGDTSLSTIAVVPIDRRRTMQRLFVTAHVATRRLATRLASERGQGTVEYVGLILLVSMLMVGMVAAMKGFNGTSGTEIAEVIISKIKQAVNAITFR
jgi:hypothetical protein